MSFVLIANIITCVCAFAGLIYGSIKFFKPKKAIYLQMITLAEGCLAFGRLYQVVRLVSGGNIFGEFQLGVLGIFGSLMFLFSANFGAMDSLADDRSKKFRKYRIIPLVAPAIAAVQFILFVANTTLPLLAVIVSAVNTVLVMLASYFSLKHLIFPDVDFGVIKCLKLYNLFALIYSFFCMVEMYVLGTGNGTLILIMGILMGADILAIVISAERGIKRWTI